MKTATVLLGFYENNIICFVFMRPFALHTNDFRILTLPDNTSFSIATYWTSIILTNFIFHYQTPSEMDPSQLRPLLMPHLTRVGMPRSITRTLFSSQTISTPKWFQQPNRISVSVCAKNFHLTRSIVSSCINDLQRNLR